MSRKAASLTWDAIAVAYRGSNAVRWHVRDLARTAGFRMSAEPRCGFVGWSFTWCGTVPWLLSLSTSGMLTTALLAVTCLYWGLGGALIAASQVIKARRGEGPCR